MSREPSFERAFRAQAAREGIAWRTLRIPRRAAGGEAVAHRLTPRGPPCARLLAVHGAGNDALFALVGLFQALLARGVEVFTFDVDGHGRQSTTRLDAGAVRGAIPAALEAARATAPHLPVHAVGVSLGGALLLRALADLPGAFQSAALLAAPLEICFSGRAVRAELGMPLLRTLWREREHYGLGGLIPSFGPVKRNAYPLRLAAPRPGAFGYVQALNELLGTLDLEAAAEAVEVRTLLVYGGADRLVPAEQGRRLAERLRNSRLLVLPGESHLSVPLAPESTRAVVEQVLEQC